MVNVGDKMKLILILFLCRMSSTLYKNEKSGCAKQMGTIANDGKSFNTTSLFVRRRAIAIVFRALVCINLASSKRAHQVVGQQNGGRTVT